MMINKELEILNKGTTKNKLTITPTRVTVKLVDDITFCIRTRILAFAAKVAKDPSMNNCTQSYRSCFNENPDGYLYVQMQTNAKNTRTTIKFCEDLLK